MSFVKVLITSKDNEFHNHSLQNCKKFLSLQSRFSERTIGEMLEWLKRHAWKACIRQKRIPSSNLGLSANQGMASQRSCGAFLMASTSKTCFRKGVGSGISVSPHYPLPKSLPSGTHAAMSTKSDAINKIAESWAQSE